jgi:hypothetical protein
MLSVFPAETLERGDLVAQTKKLSRNWLPSSCGATVGRTGGPTGQSPPRIEAYQKDVGRLSMFLMTPHHFNQKFFSIFA